MFLSGRLQL